MKDIIEEFKEDIKDCLKSFGIIIIPLLIIIAPFYFIMEINNKTKEWFD